MKIVGLNGITTRKGEAAVLVHMVGQFSQHQTKAIGQSVETAFIMENILDKAAGVTPYDKLIGRECRVFYNKSGFVDDFVIYTPEVVYDIENAAKSVK